MGVLCLCKAAVGIIHSPRRLGYICLRVCLSFCIYIYIYIYIYMCVCVCVCVCVQGTGCDTNKIFKQSKASLNSEFPFSWTGHLIKTPVWPPIFSKPVLRTGGFMLFPRALATRKIQTAPSKAWIRVANLFSKFFSITFTFGQIPWEKIWTTLSSQLWIK